MRKMGIFTKMILLIFIIMVPVIGLYGYSNNVSVSVVRDEIQAANLAQLTFLSKQLDTVVEQLSMMAITLSNDPNVREYQNVQIENTMYNTYSSVRTHKLIEQKLKLQSASTHWMNTLTIYSPNAGKAVSTKPGVVYDAEDLRSRLSKTWTLQHEPDRPDSSYFVKHITSPIISDSNVSRLKLVTEITFSTDNIRDLLGQYKAGKQNDPFLYRPGSEPIMSAAGNARLIGSLLARLENGGAGGIGERSNEVVRLDGQSYLMNSVAVGSLGWYLVDYVPLQHMLAPITKSRNLFYGSIGLLLCMSIAAVVLLYKNVQVPIRQLVRSVQRLKKGDYSVRIENRDNEFSFLFQRFNEMAEEIGRLIDNVYAEKLRSREATLKHLQSQINPHFLYNCLAFIRSMTRLGEKEAVMDMALHLGNYYRYTTRNERQLTSLREELNLVTDYLTIQSLQTQRLDYDIHLPEDELLSLEIPKLTLQPIVENSIKHGIERKTGSGLIHIYGCREPDGVTLVVEDNGTGMDEAAMAQLRTRLTMPLEDEMGCGLWNVHQRLLYHFGEGSGLSFEASPAGGLRVLVKLRTHN